MRWCCTWDPDGLYWQVCAYEVAEKHDVFSTQYRFCPVVCYRSSIVAGEPWGYGPGLGCLPDVKVGNRIVQLELQSAAIAVSGVWQAEDDGVLNPRSVKLTPGAIIPIAQGSKGLQPLQFPGRIDISQAKLDEIQNNVKRAFYVVKVKPEDAARMTATGYAGQKDQMIREMRGMYGQLRSEFAEPVMLRTLELGERMGLVKEPLMERLTDVLLVGPLAQDVQGAEVQRVGQGHHGDRAGGRAGRRHGGGQAVRAGAVGGRQDARREQGVPEQARAGEAGDAGGADREPDAGQRSWPKTTRRLPRGSRGRGDRAGAADAREGGVSVTAEVQAALRKLTGGEWRDTFPDAGWRDRLRHDGRRPTRRGRVLDGPQPGRGRLARAAGARALGGGGGRVNLADLDALADATSRPGPSWRRQAEPPKEPRELQFAFVRAFRGPDGLQVLDHLQRLTIGRAMPATATPDQLRHLEGQRELVLYILNRSTAGSERSDPPCRSTSTTASASRPSSSRSTPTTPIPPAQGGEFAEELGTDAAAQARKAEEARAGAPPSTSRARSRCWCARAT
jgi:hypothetical protein